MVTTLEATRALGAITTSGAGVLGAGVLRPGVLGAGVLGAGVFGAGGLGAGVLGANPFRPLIMGHSRRSGYRDNHSRMGQRRSGYMTDWYGHSRIRLK